MKRFIDKIFLAGAALLAVLPTILTSCSDDESFTTDKGAVLAFSRDTVRFDTVFVGVSSSTERFCAYNRNSDGVRISHVQLKSGGTSGFKMNVDGQYGVSIDGVEVLKEDSIFVFVEVNVAEQAADVPTRVEDAIVFTLESGVQQQVVLEAYGQNVRVLRAEMIEEDRTLEAPLPYLVYDSLVVAEGATLTIGKGATLCFHNGASLVVRGELKMEGTREERVTLRGDRTDRMFTYLPYDRLDNQWGGIYVAPSCTGCAIDYADIHGGNFGVVCDSIEGLLTIRNSVIHNVGGAGLFLQDSRALVANTQISNSRSNCVTIFGGTADFYHCTLAQFCPWTADRGNALVVSNYANGEDVHLTEAAFYNCFVTGYADDEVYGDDIGQPLNLNFYHCVLLTDVSDSTYFHDCTAEDKELDCYKATNFRTMDTGTYFYDFHLDSLSTAREKASAAFSSDYPFDPDGTPRGEKPDAGCYQFVPQP